MLFAYILKTQKTRFESLKPCLSTSYSRIQNVPECEAIITILQDANYMRRMALQLRFIRMLEKAEAEENVTANAKA
jgi:hypothetical protein